MVKILDCTLRDGGYYNSWNFNLDLVNKYISSVSKSKIDCVELGFRFMPSVSLKGNFALTSEELINSLNLPDQTEYSLMINAIDYIKEEDVNLLINKQFKKAIDSRVSIVRIAIKIENYKDAESVSSSLKKLGYKVAINLMQSHFKDVSFYKDVSTEIGFWGSVDILYFADSFGVMDQKEVKRIFNSLKSGWSKEIGFHSHDNNGLSLVNSLELADQGIDWIDSTISGMGRGAGNTKTQELLESLKVKKLHSGKTSELSNLSSSFKLLKEKYRWGANKFYKYASTNLIHPTYVQNLLSEERYTESQIMDMLISLSEKESSYYDADRLINTVYENNSLSLFEGDWDSSNSYESKEVLLIGAGKTVKSNLSLIKDFASKRDLIVFFLNNNNLFSENFEEGVIVSHIDRAMIDLLFLKSSSTKLIIPAKRFRVFNEYINKFEILDYGLILEEDSFDPQPNYCKVFTPNVSAYALALMYQAGVKTIFLAGLDGYDQGDPRNAVMENILTKFIQLKDRPDIFSLTKTIYQTLISRTISKDLLI